MYHGAGISSVSIVTARVRFLAVARDLSVLYSVQTSSGAHLASYPMGTGALFLEESSWGITLGHYSDHSHLFLVLRLNMVELYLHSPITVATRSKK
jgi:hypothetical protein